MNYRTTLPVVLVALVISVASSAARAADVKLTHGATSVKVEIDGKEFTTYHFLAGDDKHFHRPFAYPVYAADGQLVTSDQIVTNPKEHPHHRSFWVAHGDVNGIDHWAHKGFKQRHVGFDRVGGDTIVERLEWEGKTADATPLLNEVRTLRFFALEDGTRGIDLTVALGASSPDAPEVVAAVDHVIEAGQKSGIAVGMFVPRNADVASWRAKGATLFLQGSDHSFLRAGAAALQSECR